MIELGRREPREPVLAALLNAFEERYRQAESADLRQTWFERLNTLRRHVTITSPGGDEFRGVAVGVDDDGALIVESDDGARRTFIAGEVTLREAAQSGQ